MLVPHVRALLPALCLAGLILALSPGDGASSRLEDGASLAQLRTEPTSSYSEPILSYIVTFDTETRWDAWSASLTRSDSSRSPGAFARRDPDGAHVAGGSFSNPSRFALAAAMAAADDAATQIARRTAPIADVVAAHGGTVVSSYDTALAGMLIHVTPAAARRIAARPDVEAIRPAPVVSAQLLDSVPGVGATSVHQDLGFTGAGATVAIVDTGVDYTHAALGGPGTVGAYEAAVRQAEIVEDRWLGAPLFPNVKVIGGYDFAGPLYDPGCTAVAERQGFCATVPTPDPDPLDTHGHGTHVASIAAGTSSDAVGTGVAPGANVVALKIFGSSGTTDLIIDPIEWAIEANMGVGDRPRIHVLNLSVGQRYGAEILHEARVVRRALDAGIVVVASVGNDSYLPFIAAAPGIAPEALAVASHNPPGQHVWTASLTPPSAEPVTFDAGALFHLAWSPSPREGLTAEVVYVGRGCPGGEPGDTVDPYLADPIGRIVMFDLAWGNGGPSCLAERQARRAQEAGAVGVLIAMGLGIDMASRWEGYPLIDIPAWTINQRLESTILELSPEDTPAILELRTESRPDEDGVVSEFSSRGPARTGDLKPNLSAPGAGIFAAAMGQGTRGVAHSGTSMAAPHVAGSAALVWSAALARGDGRSARDIAATLVTSADPARLHQSTERRETPPVARTGAGALDAYGAVHSTSGARAGAIADLGMGVLALTDPITRELSVTVSNRTTATVGYTLSPRFRVPEDGGMGLELHTEEAMLQVDAGGEAAISVTAIVDPASLPTWRVLGGAGVGDVDALAASELDGWLEITSDADGTGDSVQRVPFYLLARRASEVEVQWPEIGTGPELQLSVVNKGSFGGAAELFELVALDGPDPALPRKVDVDAVGVRAIPDGQGNTVVEFLVHARGSRVHPLETKTTIEMDTDLDGRVDYIAYTEDEAFLRTRASRNGRVKAALDEPGGSPFGSPTARFFAYVDLNSRFTGVPIIIEDTGLTPSSLRFQFRVRQQDFVEGDTSEWALYDQVPDGDGWLLFDGRSRGEVPRVTRRALGGHDQTDITVSRPGGAGLLVVFPDNAPGDGDYAVWPEPEDSIAISLPWIGVGASLE